MTTVAAHPSMTVVITASNGPEFLRICLKHIFAQTVPPNAVIVVDSSIDPAGRDLITNEFTGVHYLPVAGGPTAAAAARLVGLAEVATDVAVFVDDDSYPRPDWLESLRRPYGDSMVGGVGGPIQNGERDEPDVVRGQVGIFLPNGSLVDNFTVVPGRDIEVDHLPGPNMSYRTQIARSYVARVAPYRRRAGFDADVALRMRRAGWKLVLTPTAVVDRFAPPTPSEGLQAELAAQYQQRRDHIVMLGEIVGYESGQYRRYVGYCATAAAGEILRGVATAGRFHSIGARPAARALGSALLNSGAVGVGVTSGLLASARLRRAHTRAEGTQRQW